MMDINNVTKKYGKVQALKGVTLSIAKGSCYGLVGPNGAGKSTLMKIMTSVIHDYMGTLEFSGYVDMKRFKYQIGYVPQEVCLEDSVSAKSNLIFFGKLYGLKGSQLRRRVKEVLAEIGLKERAGDKVKTFSGGMKRRLNIGCAIMHHPTVIIMDEPTVGIDPQSRAFIFQMIENMKRQGRTIIYASHYMEEVEQMCDEIAFLDQGRIVEKDKTDILLQKHAIPAVYVRGNGVSEADVFPLGSIENKNNGFLIKTETPLKAMEELIMLCQSNTNENELERLELVQPKLENVFMELTGSALRD